jgi:hypothetical protein
MLIFYFFNGLMQGCKGKYKPGEAFGKGNQILHLPYNASFCRVIYI